MEGLRSRDGVGARSDPRAFIRPRSPGVAYAILVVALTLLVGSLALTARHAPPPTIAEFAPQAVAKISDTAGDAGAAAQEAVGDPPRPDQSPSPEDAARAAVDVARVRQCVGDPPRQIEDPQSPPCVPYWSGDNGGATSRGVTRDEIRVSDANGTMPALLAFVNERFELYGRRIRLIRRPAPVGNDGHGDPAGQRAAARAAYEEDEAFASPIAYGSAYIDELTRLGIVGVGGYPFAPETFFQARRPYAWAYAMGNDRLFATTGDWYCARFAGRNAVHAGDPLIRGTRRKVGIILSTSGVEGTSAEPMNARLASCGSRTDAVIQNTDAAAGDAAYYAAFMENAILQMKTTGVTTVACLADVGWVALAMAAATNQGYLPEWLLNTFQGSDYNAFIRALPKEQTSHIMTITALPMERGYADHPSNWAMQESTGGSYPAGSLNQQIVEDRYRPFLLLASGIQMAGPNLTPETFERGLHRTRFPNPAHRIMAGSVGFEDGDHSMTDDVAEMWWNNTAPSQYPEDGAGAYCYVDHGARRRLGQFPTDDPFFKGDCDNGAV